MSDTFTPEELHTLREHGIVIHADRMLYGVQPPLPQARIDEIEALCAAPLPPALIALWRKTAGGELAYDLRATMDGNDEALSWSELFYDGSEHYRDLQGWIEHEQECAEEAAEESGTEWDGKLRYLPIGGFEYCDRIYVVVAPGPHYGSVVAWKRGLPGWTHTLQQDAIVTFADDLDGAFAALNLESDPETDLDSPGVFLLEYLDERVESAGLPRPLADKLGAFYRAAMLDWRGPLADGSLLREPRLASLALAHAVAENDAGLVRHLALLGMRFDAPLRGSATPVDVALMGHADEAARALIEAGAPVPADALNHIDKQPDPGLVALLLDRGATACGLSMAKCVACGSPEAARLVAQAAGPGITASFEEARASLAADYKESLRRVRTGKLSHYLGEAGLAERLENLKAFTA
ncbi:SMI1/KNR4 family protein [Pseudomonadota bacterium AL_CKDN230030165-1A_HGKHYDSX7]